MPNTSSVYQSLCDRICIHEEHRSKLLWASIVGAPLVWWLFCSRSQPKTSPDTNINAFFKIKAAVQFPAAQQARRKATSFHSFLKEVPQAHRDASSFSAFLKARGSKQAAATGIATQQQVDHGPKAADAVITVLFGTEYGFSKEVAERAAKAIAACGSYWCVSAQNNDACMWQ